MLYVSAYNMWLILIETSVSKEKKNITIK